MSAIHPPVSFSNGAQSARTSRSNAMHECPLPGSGRRPPNVHLWVVAAEAARWPATIRGRSVDWRSSPEPPFRNPKQSRFSVSNEPFRDNSSGNRFRETRSAGCIGRDRCRPGCSTEPSHSGRSAQPVSVQRPHTKSCLPPKPSIAACRLCQAPLSAAPKKCGASSMPSPARRSRRRMTESPSVTPSIT